ncbi:MAG: glycosyltransferase family 4 protein [Candidatus Woesearchaeota archaeon]
MKKILIATDGFLPRWDGIASFLNVIIQDDYELTIIAPNLGDYNYSYKAKIIKFNTIKIRLGDNYFASKVNLKIMANEIKKNDIVFVQCLGPIGIWGIILGKHFKKKVVMYNHMIEWEVFPQSQGINFLKVPINIITKFFSLKLYKKCDVIIVPSLEQAELLNILGVKSEKRVVHLGVDVKKFKPPVAKTIAKQEIGIDTNKFVIGYAGRVSLEKDIKTLYRAFVRFNKKYGDSLLLIAGGGRPELENLFLSKKDVVLTGLKNNLAPYFQAMDIYVHPSLVETTSLTTMEAMATGLAVIATPVGFIKEYIDEGVNGFLFPKKNSIALFEKLCYLRENPDKIIEIGRNARKTIIENYTWEKTANELKKIFDQLS